MGGLTIGQLARMTGLSVKTIRWYSDQGLVPPAGRSAAGYRLYDSEALVRLELVRTLRRLATHVEALDAQIRGLRLRRAVLRMIATRGGSPEEVDRMHELARLSEEERRHVLTDFFDDVFGGLSIDPDFERGMRSVTPDLPEHGRHAHLPGAAPGRPGERHRPPGGAVLAAPRRDQRLAPDSNGGPGLRVGDRRPARCHSLSAPPRSPVLTLVHAAAGGDRDPWRGRPGPRR